MQRNRELLLHISAYLLANGYKGTFQQLSMEADVTAADVEATSHVDLLKALEVYEQYVANTSSKKSNLELQLPTEATEFTHVSKRPRLQEGFNHTDAPGRHLAPTCPLGDTPAVPAHARPASSSSAQQVPTQQQPDTMQHPHNITEAGSTGCRGADSSSSKQSNHEQLGPAGMCSVLKPGDLVTLDHLTQSAEGALQQSGKQQQFKVLEPIGWGAMGEVYKVQVPQAASKDVTGSKLASSPNSTLPASPAHPASRAKQSSDLPGQLYALKLPKPYHLASPVLQQQLPAMLYYPHVYASLGQEQQIMAQLADTDNITKCHGCGTLQYSDGMKLRALLMELAPGTLQQQLQPTPSTLAPMGAKQAWLVMRHVSGGLRDLHEAGYVYRDLKPANVLRFQYQEEDDESPYDFYKLSDFNTTVAVDQHGMVQGTGTGTFGFIAPEEYQQLEHNASSDSWSAGCLLLALRTGRQPFFHLMDLTVVEAMERMTYEEVVSCGHYDCLEPVELDCVRHCLVKDWKQRQLVAQLQRHEYLESGPAEVKAELMAAAAADADMLAQLLADG